MSSAVWSVSRFATIRISENKGDRGSALPEKQLEALGRRRERLKTVGEDTNKTRTRKRRSNSFRGFGVIAMPLAVGESDHVIRETAIFRKSGHKRELRSE
jgi:hypothetical protein